MIDGGQGKESPVFGAKRRLVVQILRFGTIFKFISLVVRMPKLALATVRGCAFIREESYRKENDQIEQRRTNNFLFTSRKLEGTALILLYIDFPHKIIVEKIT